MSFLRSVRPSNFIILTALPFIVYLFAVSGDYQRSLKAILGVENGSSAFVPGFLVLALAFLGGLGVLFFSRVKKRRPRAAAISAGLNVLAALALLWSPLVHPFAASVVANGVDAFTSTLVVKGVTPRQLTEAADLMVRGVEAWLFPLYLVLSLAGLVLFLKGGEDEDGPKPLRRAGGWLLGTVNGAGALVLFFFVHIAFAAGVATTIRAAVAAYILASVLGLVWVGLLQLKATMRTYGLFTLATALLVVAAAWFLLQPRDTYVLFGTLEGKVGVVAGTPSSLVGAVRFGQYEGGPVETETPLRTFKDPAAALAFIAKDEGVSGALLPAAHVPADKPVLWTIEALNDRDRAAGIAVSVLAIVCGLLTFGGFMHNRHPLAIGSELVVDTIRGIPMLVIVLYVGLPLSGALKDATQGVLDPPNIMRGIVAMALAYSAYLAEIFRSGINAIPAGQIEAAKSMGLNGWHTARLIVLPQAFRIIIPPLGNELIAILKDTSLLSILSIRDITQRMREFQSASFLPFAPYNSAAIFYILLTLAAASLVNTVERKYVVRHR